MRQPIIVPFGGSPGSPVLGCNCLACVNARKVQARDRRNVKVIRLRGTALAMVIAGVWLVIAGIVTVAVMGARP